MPNAIHLLRCGKSLFTVSSFVSFFSSMGFHSEFVICPCYWFTEVGGDHGIFNQSISAVIVSHYYPTHTGGSDSGLNSTSAYEEMEIALVL